MTLDRVADQATNTLDELHYRPVFGTGVLSSAKLVEDVYGWVGRQAI